MIIKIFSIISLAFCFLSFAEGQTLVSSPQLVIRSGATVTDDRGTVLHRIHFNATGALVVLGSQGDRTKVWTIDQKEETAEFGGNHLLTVRAAQWLSDLGYLVASAPPQMSIWDLKRWRKLREINISTIDSFPLTCHSNGLCAWEESVTSGRVLRVQSLTNQSSGRELPLGNDVALDLDISPDGQHLAAAVNRAVVRIWSLGNGQERTAWQLQAGAKGNVAASSLTDVHTIIPTIPKLFVPYEPGMSTAVRFSPNGKLLAVANENAIHVFSLNDFSLATVLRGYDGHITCLAFDVSGGRLFAAGEDRVIRMWTPQTAAPGVIVARLARMPTALTIHPNGKVVAASFPGGKLELWHIERQQLLVTITFLPDQQGWIAATPEGLFETSEGAWRYASWRFREQPDKLFPVEHFYLNFYRSGLIAELLEGGNPRPPIPLDREAFEVPQVKISVISTSPAHMVLTPGEGIRHFPETTRFRIEVRPASARGGAFDLSLMHNGIVVQKWPGQLPLHHGVAVQEFELELHPADNHISAFAFNHQGVRSVEAVWERAMQGWGYVAPQRTLYVISIGVGTYRNSSFNLRFPAADATLVEQALMLPTAELEKMKRRLSEWWNNDVLRDLESVRGEDMPAQVQITKLTDAQATRTRILQTIRETAQKASQHDAVLIFYSGHGLSDGYNYYLLPSDMGLRSAFGKTKPAEIRAAASTLIATEDLEEVLLPLRAGYAALILDACQSGQALEDAKELRGPRNPRGLARLAYEKGMYLLAASEDSQPARELERLGYSVLTYALFREGLQERQADSSPLNGRIELREWLNYGAGRVQALVQEMTRNKDTVGVKASDITQRAQLVPRWTPETTALVLFTGEKQP
jgi:WD40 repeat protein/uncharacterized caspase-like protein